MQFHIADKELKYDGSQLCSHFALCTFKIRGDCIVAFQGPMDITADHMADLEDLLAGESIRSGSMLHFIAEFFDAPLETVILKQRLLARLAADILAKEAGAEIAVIGDDLYVEDRKLSVSIAAPTPVSAMIHFGLNITIEDVPVKAACLQDLGMKPEKMALLLAQAFVEEMASVRWALCKVRDVP